MKKINIIAAAALLLLTATTKAQSLSYGQYMEQVLCNNIALTAQRLNIEIATAKIKASKVRNNPTLAITYSSNEDWSKKLGDAIEGELSRTFTFGVRESGIKVAEQNSRETAALLEEYLRNFRADATIAYLEHLKAIEKLKIEGKIEEELKSVARNDSLRHASGEIAKAEWLESSMAAGIAQNNRLAAEAAVKTTAVALGYYMGNLDNAAEITGSGTLEINEPTQPLHTYTEKAISNRADLQAAICRIDIAEAAKKFNAAQRRTDLNVTVGATYNRGARNEEPHAPSFTTVKAGVAIPIKISNLNKGARTIDRLLVQQAEQEAQDARLLVTSEVMQAYNEYRYATLQAETFTLRMIDEMNEIVAGKRKAYERGEIPFLDYISIERRQGEMEAAHLEALFNKAVKWVELQRAVGCKMEFAAEQMSE